MNKLLSIKTIGALRETGYEVLSVKDEIRKNMLAMLKDGKSVFSGIIGYENTVIPEIINAILSRHDFILLGLRGQAKSRILRMLPGLLDEYMPIIKDSEINDNPFKPISKAAVDMVREHGDEVEIEWIHREQRYGEKLATPDVTIADLIGDIDPIKAAVHRLHYAHEGVIHYGIIPRTNRGIFAINELPDLQPRIQVGLFNLMQEKDIQIRGFPIRIPIDVLMVYSANPEDYTNRGNIITPLKDRIGSQILTHYPLHLETSMAITAQEAWINRDGKTVKIFPILREIVEQTAIEARRSEFVDQKSGVSARMTISSLENVISNAERRSAIHSSNEIVPRVCDLFTALSAITGKIELVYEGEQEGVTNVAKGLLGKAVKQTFLNYLPEPYKSMKKHENHFEKVVAYFKGDRVIDISDQLSDADYHHRLQSIPGLEALVDKFLSELVGEHAAFCDVAMEFILEGLHQNSLLSKDELEKTNVYGDMLKSMFSGLEDDNDDEDDDLFTR
ncbi:magnesium chelatase [candidate division KSB1 bacterium]|nr:magnesium chelatase [candidate division KSB1 bacterium]